MNKIVKIFGILIFALSAPVVYASDECENCEDTDTCPPPPPGESMSVELGE